MTNGNETNKILAEAAEKIRREAYAAGWRDAVAAMNKATSELAEPNALPEGMVDFSMLAGSASGGPTAGSTPWYVLQAVRKNPGMTGSEVVSVVQKGGHKVSDASIRTSLIRLDRKKLIVSRHKKWFPA